MGARRKAVVAISLAALVFTSIGCATKVAIRSVEPGRVSVGGTKQLVIVDGQGRRSARETVYQQIINQCRSRGYFSAMDRSEDGIAVRIAGRRVELDGAESPLEPGQAGVRVDVLEWNAVRDNMEVTKKDEAGKKYVEVVPVKVGTALLAVTVFEKGGRAFLAEKEYEGAFTTKDLEMPKEDVIEAASLNAVSLLLGDITPRPVVSYVVLDDDDPGQEAILATAEAGNIAQAADDTRRYLEQHPNNPAAAYNLAVFLEAMGEYEDALAMYDRALSLGNKSFYINARAGCARRLAASQELSSAPSGGGASGTLASQ